MQFLKKIKQKIFPTKYLVCEIKKQLEKQQHSLLNITHRLNDTFDSINETQNKIFNHQQKLDMLDEIKHLTHENQRIQHELLEFKAFYIATHQHGRGGGGELESLF